MGIVDDGGFLPAGSMSLARVSALPSGMLKGGCRLWVV